MTEATIIQNMTRGWNQDPSHVAYGTNRTGVSAALWTSQLDTIIEVNADPLTAHHIVCLQLKSLKADFWQDDCLSYSGSYAPGDVSIVPAGRRPSAVMHGKFACLHLYVPDSLLKETLASEDFDGSAQNLEVVDPRRVYDPLIDRIGKNIVSEMQNNLPLARLRVDAMGLELAVQLLRKYSANDRPWKHDRRYAKGGLAPWQMRRCIEILNSDLAHDHNMSALAIEIGLSPFHFARSFKQSFGVPPYTYLTKLRMDHASKLLLNTDLQVTQVALEVGYDTSQALARAFRKQFSCCPREFRRSRWY